MANPHQEKYLNLLENKLGDAHKIGVGYSLYQFSEANTIVYFRYSKINYTPKIPQAFYGLRKSDIDIIKGQNKNKKSFIFLLTNEADKNIFIPYDYFADYFDSAKHNTHDQQYKLIHYFKPTGNLLYFPGYGRYSTETFQQFDAVLHAQPQRAIMPDLSHSQVQSLVGAMGISQGYDLYFPAGDRGKLDYSILNNARLRENLPAFSHQIDRIISQIDVIWLNGNQPKQLFEVEHSTSIYSGLLRFNDVLLTIGNVEEFNIIAKTEKENKFGLEIKRPTFTQNKLNEKTTFMSYNALYQRYYNLTGEYYGNKM